MSNPPTGISRSSFHIALSAIIVCSAIVWSSGNLAACADMFDHEMRKLHSKQQVDICKLVGGKPALIINTASHCGYTRQFKGLEALYQRYKDQGLVIIGFASDDFNQEAKDEAKADINAMLFSSFSDEGQKFWFCGVCNFSHKDKFRVFMHADSKHYEYGVNCDECGKKSSTLNALQEHKSRYHKFK